MGRVCAFVNCSNTKALFSFPRDAAQAEAWLHAAGVRCPTKRYAKYVCKEHFLPDSFENWGLVQTGFADRLLLKKDAVPVPFVSTVCKHRRALCREVETQTEVLSKDASCQTHEDSPASHHASAQHEHKNLMPLKEEKQELNVTEDTIDLIPLKEENEELNVTEDKEQTKGHHEFKTEEQLMSCLKTENTSSPAELNQHLKVETGVSLFTCPQCGQVFSLQRRLKLHMRSHAEKMPSVCSECGKSFKRRSVLNSHMIIHSGERPYTCPQCGKSFRIKGNFRAHIRLHTGEKPYTCKPCGKTFSSKKRLTAHVSALSVAHRNLVLMPT